MTCLSALLSCQPAAALFPLFLMQRKIKGYGCLAVKECTKQQFVAQYAPAFYMIENTTDALHPHTTLLKHGVVYDETGRGIGLRSFAILRVIQLIPS